MTFYSVFVFRYTELATTEWTWSLDNNIIQQQNSNFKHVYIYLEIMDAKIMKNVNYKVLYGVGCVTTE